jgi:hypothetical protein
MAPPAPARRTCSLPAAASDSSPSTPSSTRDMPASRSRDASPRTPMYMARRPSSPSTQRATARSRWLSSTWRAWGAGRQGGDGASISARRGAVRGLGRGVLGAGPDAASFQGRRGVVARPPAPAARARGPGSPTPAAAPACGPGPGAPSAVAGGGLAGRPGWGGRDGGQVSFGAAALEVKRLPPGWQGLQPRRQPLPAPASPGPAPRAHPLPVLLDRLRLRLRTL